MCTARGLTIRGGKPQLLARLQGGSKVVLLLFGFMFCILQGGPTTQGFGSLSTPQLRQKLIATGVPLKGEIKKSDMLIYFMNFLA